MDIEPLGDFDIIGETHDKQWKEERRKQVNQQLKLDHLTPEEQKEMRRLCMEFADVFQLDGEPFRKAIGKQDQAEIQHCAGVQEAVPDYVANMKKEDIIEPNVSA